MSLDLYLEADNALTVQILGRALEEAGACEVIIADGALEAAFTSGLTVACPCVTSDSAIYAENTKGIDFPVAMRCNIRIKGPEPEGHSAMGDLEKIAQSVVRACSCYFLISFQFEQTLFWRNADGLHHE